MTSKQERVQESFRVTLEERKTIDRLHKLSGIASKQDYLREVALKGLASEISDTSLAGVVASQQRTIESLTRQLEQAKSLLAIPSGDSNQKKPPGKQVSNIC